MDFFLKDAENGKMKIDFSTKDENPFGSEFNIDVPVFKWAEKSDPKTGKKHLYIAGFASTSGLDRQMDNISELALRDASEHLLKAGSRTVFFNHEHRQLPIGLTVDSKYDEFLNEDGELIKGIYVVVKISNADGVKDIRTQIKEDILNSFSIGGKFDSGEEVLDEDGEFLYYMVNKMTLYEVSVVGIPAQTRAGILESVTKQFDLDASITEAKVVESKEIEENKTLRSSKSQDKTKEANYENVWNSVTGEKTGDKDMSEKKKETQAPAEAEKKEKQEVAEEKEDEKTDEVKDEKTEDAPEYLTVGKAEELITTKIHDAIDPIKKQFIEFSNSITEALETLKGKEETEKTEEKEEPEEDKKDEPDVMKTLLEKIDGLEKKVEGALEDGKALGAARGQIEAALNTETEDGDAADVEAKRLKEEGIDVTKDFDDPQVARFYLEEHQDKYNDLTTEQKEKVKIAWYMDAQRQSVQ